MSENYREPEVPEEKVPVVECLDGLARITSKEFASTHSVKNGTLQNVLQDREWLSAGGKSAFLPIARLMNSRAKGLKIMMTNVQWQCCKVHDTWVAYVKIWSRRSLHRFCERAQTYGSQSDVFDSPKPSYVMLTFETKILRSDIFAQVSLHERNPTLQNLRIGL